MIEVVLITTLEHALQIQKVYTYKGGNRGVGQWQAIFQGFSHI